MVLKVSVGPDMDWWGGGGRRVNPGASLVEVESGAYAHKRFGSLQVIFEMRSRSVVAVWRFASMSRGCAGGLMGREVVR